MAAPERDISFAEASLDDVAIPLDDEVPFGRYQLCYEVGSGGMATVFLARTAGPGRFTKAVALKRIHPHLVKRKDFVAMFLDEARIASLISHPNVCSAFDFGEVDGTYYMAMEYLVGEPLSHMLRNLAQRPALLATERWVLLACRIAADVCEGLHAAHELRDETGQALSIVHRDVSPQNVFVTYDGAVKLVDFGVAFARDRLTETVAGTIKGKLAYLAPEQLTPGAQIDRRVDVWAMGVTLWEMLTCKRLFARRSDGATLVAIQSQEAPLVSSVIANVPPELDAIVARALARDPADRYPTARAVGRDLSSFVAQSGRSVAMADVQEMMTELFTERRPEKLEALSVVMEPTGIRRRRATRTLDAAPPSAVPNALTKVLGTPVSELATEISGPGTASLPGAGTAALLGGGVPPSRGAASLPGTAPRADGTTPLSMSDLTPLSSSSLTPVLTPMPAPFARAHEPPRARWPMFATLAVAGVITVGAVAWGVSQGQPQTSPPPAPAPNITPLSAPIALSPTPPPSLAVAPVIWTRVPDSTPTPTPPPPPDDPVVADPPPVRGGARPVGWGQARFVCGVWADVREHGQRLGRTPAVIRLHAGHHNVDFVAADGHRTTRSFELAANASPVIRCER